MEICPAYHAPLNRYESTWSHETYRESMKLFDQGQHRESLRTLMDAVNRELAEKRKIGPDRWVVPHGSLVVEISITDEDTVRIQAPFIRLPAERRAPILRQIWELNTGPLTLGLIKLDGDELAFHFETPLDLADPFKTYTILHEICVTGDNNDDLFVNELGADFLGDKDVAPLPAEGVERAWDLYRSLLEEAAKNDAYYAGKRQLGYCFDVLGIALMQVDYVIAPQGYTRAKLERATSLLWEHAPMEEILAQLRREHDFFQKMERQAFESDLYRSTFFVGDRKSAEVQTCQKAIAQRHDWAGQDKSARCHQGVVLNYLFAAYHLLYTFYLPEQLDAEIRATLEACGGQPWEAAEPLAWASFQKIMDPAFA